MSHPRQKILMCAPDYFGVRYVINAWMQNHVGRADQALAARQWDHLCQALAPHAELVFIAPQPSVPDMVFTANAGLVLGGSVIVSRFQEPERQGETPLFHDWFLDNRFNILDWPPDLSFEGAGDALFDRAQPIVWCGHGFRTAADAAPEIEKRTGRRAVALKLVDPYFYHLDTCLCPLAGGWLMYYPPAFDRESQEKILATVAEDKRIIVSGADAALFACNAVDLNGHIVLNGASDDLQKRLSQVGLTPVITPLSEFMKAGGGAKCLTLKLVEV